MHLCSRALALGARGSGAQRSGLGPQSSRVPLRSRVPLVQPDAPWPGQQRKNERGGKRKIEGNKETTLGRKTDRWARLSGLLFDWMINR